MIHKPLSDKRTERDSNQTGIKTYYSGDLGEIRHSKFYSANIDFKDKACLSFKYVLKGQENYVLEGQHYKVNEKQVLFFSANKPYQSHINHHGITKGLCIDLDVDLGKYAQMDVLNEKELFFFSPEFQTQKINFLDDQLHLLLHQIVELNEEEQALRLEEILQEVSKQIVDLETEFVERIQSIPNKNEAYKKEVFKRLIAAKNFIQDNRYQKIHLADIAKESGLSAFYLHRLFKHVFGYTPAQYQEKIRMLEAKTFLRYLSVKETSYSLGFSDDAYFSKRFKLHFGIRPGKYARSLH